MPFTAFPRSFDAFHCRSPIIQCLSFQCLSLCVDCLSEWIVAGVGIPVGLLTIVLLFFLAFHAYLSCAGQTTKDAILAHRKKASPLLEGRDTCGGGTFFHRLLLSSFTGFHRLSLSLQSLATCWHSLSHR